MLEDYLGRLGLYFYTLRYLKFSQIWRRVVFGLYKPRPDLSPCPMLRNLVGQWKSPVSRCASMSGERQFSFLNEEHEIFSSEDWNSPDLTKLWLYNLHYFDDLNAMGASGRTVWHRQLVEDWILANPPGNGYGWDSYPLSLRIVNWIKWSLAGNILNEETLHSLAVQARYLTKRLERHILGNHLFANAKALVFAGFFFEGAEANNWIRIGMDILTREIPEQILPDGGQFERSTMYHALALEDMLDLCNIIAAYPCIDSTCYRSFIDGWRELSERMLRWLTAMCHPDGEIGFFNDAAMGIAAHPASLADYGVRLGVPVVADVDTAKGVTLLRESGYVRIQQGPAVVLIDVALVGPDYLPAHAHADTLSFELSLFAQRVLVNSGTSCYGIGEERLRQRGTAAHNTVVVDGEDSSQVWSGFRVAQRAFPSKPEVNVQDHHISVAASHNGYQRLRGRNIHRREWVMRGGSLIVEDEVLGPFLEGEARYHLHPEVKVDVRKLSEGRAVLLLSQGQEVEIFVQGGMLQVEPATWHPSFGISQSTFCLAVKFRSSRVKTVFAWQAGTA